MWTRKLLLSTIVASTFAAVAPTANAAVEVFVNVPPPAARYEVVPAPRAGYIWAPGYWSWTNNRHVWAKGRWERERAGYFYHPHTWTERDGRWPTNPAAGIVTAQWEIVIAMASQMRVTVIATAMACQIG